MAKSTASSEEIENSFGVLIDELKHLRLDLGRVKSSKIRDRIFIALVAIGMITTGYLFVKFRNEVNQRSVSGCVNFNIQENVQRVGVKNLIRGLTPPDLQSNPQSLAEFAAFDSLVDNAWRFRDCSTRGISDYRKNTKRQINCKSDGSGFCKKTTVLTIPSTTPTTGVK